MGIPNRAFVTTAIPVTLPGMICTGSINHTTESEYRMQPTTIHRTSLAICFVCKFLAIFLKAPYFSTTVSRPCL